MRTDGLNLHIVRALRDDVCVVGHVFCEPLVVARSHSCTNVACFCWHRKARIARAYTLLFCCLLCALGRDAGIAIIATDMLHLQ